MSGDNVSDDNVSGDNVSGDNVSGDNVNNASANHAVPLDMDRGGLDAVIGFLDAGIEKGLGDHDLSELMRLAHESTT